MGLSQGMRLGTYEILDLLGSGGMGEVYRAHDSKLKRHVAIKVLPETFSRDPERIARFRREAQLLAALNHPNIAAIYGLEEAGDTMALVMEEVVEGGRLTGPLSIETSLNYARQIAAALEAAHEKGIIHRDLKPANIKVSSTGVVKVLDFGLATMIQPAVDAIDAEDTQNSPTLTRTLGTQSGVIMGTAAYMSPEQAAGKPVDKRTDIWSYGVVLFEMLTGRQLFGGGETISHTLADVLRAPVNFSKLPDETPPSIRDLLRRCLDRQVNNRLRDIGEARVAIDNAGKAPEQSTSITVVRPHRLRLWIGAAVAATVIAAVAGIGWWRAAQPVERPLMRFADDVGEAINTGSANGPGIAISPDGLRLAFISQGSDGKLHLSVRSIGSSKSTVLSGAEADGARPLAPFFSPDGRWIGFFAGTKMKKIPVEGGAAVQVCDVAAGNPRGAFWGEDGNILFAGQRTPVMRCPEIGGTATPATELDKQKGEVTNRFAQLLPGGKAFLFTASDDNNSWEGANIYVQTMADGKRKKLVSGGYFGRYMPTAGGDGHLIYVHDGTVFAAPMDLGRLELTAPAAPSLEDVDGRGQNGFSQFDVSSTGTLIYVRGSSKSDKRSLALVSPAGDVQVLPGTPAEYVGPLSPSPDGTRIAVRITEGSATNLSVYELATNRLTRLTFIKGLVGNFPTWTPDGKHILFVVPTNDLSGPGTYWIRADGGGDPHRLLDRPMQPGSFSPDGKVFAYSTGPGTGQDSFGIWTVSLDLTDSEHPKPGKPEVVFKSTAPLSPPFISPDGRWIAYGTATPMPQFFVRPFLSTQKANGWQISTEAAQGFVRWAAHRNELTYLGSDGLPYVVSYTVSGDTFVANPPHLWTQTSAMSQPAQLGFAAPPVMMPDGKHVIVILPNLESAKGQSHINVLLNFSDELKRRTGGK